MQDPATAFSNLSISQSQTSISITNGRSSHPSTSRTNGGITGSNGAGRQVSGISRSDSVQTSMSLESISGPALLNKEPVEKAEGMDQDMGPMMESQRRSNRGQKRRARGVVHGKSPGKYQILRPAS